VLELSYLFSVLRRRWWLPLIGLLLGGYLGKQIGGSTAKKYTSRAVLYILPPQSQVGAGGYNSDPDRYVIGQLSSLKSSSLTELVAAKVPARTAEQISKSVTMTHEPRTDIVVISVSLDDPSDAERIANGYADIYLDGLRKQAEKNQSPLLDSTNKRIAELEASLITMEAKAATNQQTIATNNIAMRLSIGEPFKILGFQAALDAAVSENAQIAANKLIVQGQYSEELRNRSQLEIATNLKVASEIVQRAVVPSLPDAGATKLTVIGGALLGLLLGLSIAVSLARLSRRVVDRREIEDAMQIAVAGEVPRVGAAASLKKLLEHVPDDLEESIDQLCVRAESKAQAGEALTIAVVGTMSPAGTTTLAVAMASHYAHLGSSVVLVDADLSNAAITRTFASSSLGIPALLANPTKEKRRGNGTPEHDAFVAYGSVRVLGLGSQAGRASLLRAQVADVLAGAKAEASIVVVDAGEVLDSSSTLEICRLADVVVLAIPVKKQRRQLLEEIGRELSGRARSILPIITSPGSSQRHGATEVVESRVVETGVVDEKVSSTR
jgi:capsular polysaccharide biosynthesis protein